MSEHLSEEQAELYSLGECSADELESCDEHLLRCAQCRALVTEADSFALAMRTAAASVSRTSEQPARRWIFRVLAPALAASILTVAWVAMRDRGAALTAPIAVQLRVDRGPADAHALSGAALSLQPDLTGLRPGFYTMEVVNSTGERQWMTSADFRSAANVPSPALKPGTYFVRLYSSQGELKREYALLVDPR